MLDDVFLIGGATGVHLLGIFLLQFEGLLSRDLQVKHVLALDLLIAELLQHDIGMISLILQIMVQLHNHLSLGLEVLRLLVSFSYATTLNLVFKLMILLVSAPLFC